MAPKLSGKNHSNEGAMEEDGLADHSLDSAVDSEMVANLSGKNRSNEGTMEKDGLAEHSLDSAVDSETAAKLSGKSASNNGSMERIDPAELSLHPAVDSGVAPWRVAKEMEQNQSELPFHVDTEFAGDALIQLGIENAVGTQVVSSVVTHDKSWRQIQDEGHEGNRSLMKFQKNKFGWYDDWNMPPDTKTINAQELAEQQKGRYRLPAPWRMAKSMEQDESELLFYIDTEFAGDALIEIGIESAAGTQIVNSVVRHDKSWRHIYKDGHDGTGMFVNLQQKKYGWDDDWEMPSSTETIDAQELATILLDSHEPITPARASSSFRRGNMDLNRTRRFLRYHGGYDWVLNDRDGLGLMWPWAEKLPGFWHLAQALIFQLLPPDHTLADQSHRAFVDAQKLHI